MIDYRYNTGYKPGNFSRSWMTTHTMPLSSSHKIKVHSRISRQTKFHVFRDEWTNHMVTLGMRARAMWH